MIFGPLKLLLRLLSAVLSLSLLYFGVTFIQIWMTSHEHSNGTAQAILVFGTTEDNGTPSPVLAARLNQALVLYQANKAPWVVVTGGSRPGDVYSEAGVSAAYLEAHGVSSSWIIQGGGDDTWQNVSSVVAQMKLHHLRTVFTVTDPFHEFRAMAIASAQGLTPSPSPVPASPTIKSSLWLYYARETVAVGVGRIVGYGRLSSWTTPVTTIPVPSGN